MDDTTVRVIGDSFAGVATSATRVIESYCPEDQWLFDDRLGFKLLPLGWRLFLRLVYLPGLRKLVLSSRERRMPGTLGAILCRTRYIDDVLKRSLKEGVEQVVILGAGFDSRAYRIDGMDRVQVYEVDLPGTRKLKQRRVESVLGAVPDNVTLVGMDFDGDSLRDVLEAAGFQEGKRTLFIWEGVTQYISAEAVSATLEFVSDVSGAGSGIVFTYVRQGIIDGTDRPEWFASLLSFSSSVGSPFVFGLDPAELRQYLADRGLTLVNEVGAAEYRERYLKPLGREMNVFDGERVAFAEVDDRDSEGTS
ncbi:MAG: SAM-dependent methyltransferase [Anaerolineae bacterium]|jgi:methyltransferase (TIGR00027 family)